MSGAELLAAPLAGLSLVVITWYHLRRDHTPAPLFAPAWLLEETSGAELSAGRRLSAPLLWLVRLLCALTLLSAPSAWRPWADLLSTPEPPQHTLILTEGARLNPLPSWGERAWVARVDRCEGRLLWLNAQGELSEGAPHLRRLSPRKPLSLTPRTPLSSSRACWWSESKQELLARALAELSRHSAPPPERALWVSEASPRVRLVRLSWAPLSPKLIIEAHVHAPLNERSADASLSLWLTGAPQTQALVTLSPLPPPRSALWRAELSPSPSLLASLDQGVGLELRYQSPPSDQASDQASPSHLEALPLTMPHRDLVAPQEGWPEGLPPLLKSVGVQLLTPDQLSERSARGARVWRPLSHLKEGAQLYELSKNTLKNTLTPPPREHTKERFFMFEQGDEPPTSLWGMSLEQGALGRVSAWRDLNSAPFPEFAQLSQREVLLWAPVLSSTTPSPPFAPLITQRAAMLDLTPLSLPQGEAILTRLAWRPTHSEDELSALGPLMASWAALDLSALSAPLADTALLDASLNSSFDSSLNSSLVEALSALTLTPHAPQQEEALLLSSRLTTPQGSPSRDPLWCCSLLLALLLLTLTRRSFLNLMALVLSVVWLLSALPLGVKGERGLWGWWRGPSRLAVSAFKRGDPTREARVDEGDVMEELSEERQALALVWRRRLSEAGAVLTPPHLAHAHMVVCASGDCPLSPHTSSPLWLIEPPSPTPQTPTLMVKELEQRWDARLEGVWLTTHLTSARALTQSELKALGRYELRLTGRSAQPHTLKLADCEGAACLSLAPALYLPSPPQTASEGAEQAERGRALELWGGPEGEARLIERHPCPPPPRPSAPRAWRWGQALKGPLRNAGFVSRSAPSELTRLNPEALREVNLIALHNAPLEQLGASEVARLESWVRAGGVLLLSGSSVSAPDPERPLARLSPLNSTPPQRDKARVLMLIDVSGSAAREAGGLGVQALMQRANALASTLYPSDEVGLITFAGEASLALPPTPREQLEVAFAPERAYGGSRVSAALKEALRWLGDSGPQRWLILSDGELSPRGLTSLTPQLIERAQRSDLSLALAFTSDAPLSAQGRAALKALSAALPVDLRPLDAWTPSALLAWRQARSPLTPTSSNIPSQQTLRLTSRGRARLGEELHKTPGERAVLLSAEGAALSSLNEGSRALATTTLNKLSAPVIAERVLGAGRVIALNASQLTLSPSQWRALLAPARAQLKSPWRFAWRLPQHLTPSLTQTGQQQHSLRPLFTARWPGGAETLPPPLSSGWVQGREGELISGQWQPLLSDLYALRAHDGGALDERVEELRYTTPLELGALTPQGPLRAQRALPSLTPPMTPQATRAHKPAPLTQHINALTPPSKELLHQIIESGREGTPLPERALWWLVLGVLLVGLKHPLPLKDT